MVSNKIIGIDPAYALPLFVKNYYPKPKMSIWSTISFKIGSMQALFCLIDTNANFFFWVR